MAIVKSVKHRWNYWGDINLEHGGLFWREDGADDYVCAVKVTPASDGGGPDNLYIVEVGSIYLSNDANRIKSALDCCGWIETKDKPSRKEIVMAMDSYCGLDGPDTYYVRIGPKEETRDFADKNDEPDFILRGNASLKRFVRREFMNLSY